MKFPKPTKADRLLAKKQKKLARLDRLSVICQAVIIRANGRCEVPGCREPGAHCDHWWGGIGRRRKREAIENLWLLCEAHDVQRTANWPSAAWWNRAFAQHCARHGYPVLQHITRSPLNVVK